MVRSVISWCANPDTVLMDTTMSASRYVWMLYDYKILFIDEAHPNGCSLQKESATPHRTNLTKQDCMEQGPAVIGRKLRFTDLNPIKTIWCILVREVSMQRFNNFARLMILKKRVVAPWERINTETVQTLLL